MKKAENENVKLSIRGLRIINVCHLHMKRGCPWAFVSLRVVYPRNEPVKFSNNLTLSRTRGGGKFDPHFLTAPWGVLGPISFNFKQ